ncbi:hypothetical protein K491DRAFT_133374 [Lophiostoma macrostomum CBS 122681]|uniref:Uncharacterized protein n=1 Tax=Lophiostoma macrostomum CBS 122681 TaxID=1314788 RepID=A0A6A6STL1_9PLEO|nr:hypothetical protein K491DRAFT_133374 [Lophiostoma macrostomum CBS 122681]
MAPLLKTRPRVCRERPASSAQCGRDTETSGFERRYPAGGARPRSLLEVQSFESAQKHPAHFCPFPYTLAASCRGTASPRAPERSCGFRASIIAYPWTPRDIWLLQKQSVAQSTTSACGCCTPPSVDSTTTQFQTGTSPKPIILTVLRAAGPPRLSVRLDRVFKSRSLDPSFRC